MAVIRAAIGGGNATGGEYMVLKWVESVWGCGLSSHGIWELKIAGVISHVLHPTDQGGVGGDILANWREGGEGERERERGSKPCV